MRRVTRHSYEDAPIPEEQETEGQRQLHSLLLQQLDTEVDISRCVAKKKCFAPAALYKPFGQQAAGVKSLSQFQALQDGEQELASLRELGLTEVEIELWRTRDMPEAGEKGRGVCVDPTAKNQRLQVIRDKMEARAQLLSRPQRLSASRPLSRREMEIERALFHGSERLNFLSALYHQEEEGQPGQDGALSSDPLDSIYRDILKPEGQAVASLSVAPEPQIDPAQLATPRGGAGPPQGNADPIALKCPDDDCHQSEDAAHCSPVGGGAAPRPPEPKWLSGSRPIGSLCSSAKATSGGPVRVTGPVQQIPDEEIRGNRATEEEIRQIPRFRNYQRGEPSQVLCIKNLSPQATLAQLVALFSRFQRPDAPPVLYRLLTGRLKGQAFITFSDTDSAQAALELLNGYRFLDRALVVEFGRDRRDGEMGSRGRASAAGPTGSGSGPTGSGSGSGPTGSGSGPTGSGSGSGPTGTGSGPTGLGSGPTGTGSGSGPTGTGSGPTGSGTGPMGTGSGSGPTGTGSGTGPTHHIDV